MPLIFLVAVLLLLPLILVLATPFLILQRYRAGTARRRTRVWSAWLNAASMWLSAALFLFAAAIANLWIPRTLVLSLIGIAGGGVLGLLGLALTQWERTSSSLHYTPNRWLVLTITLAVAVRLTFGIWRAWNAWHLSDGEQSWVAASGIAASIGVGGMVLGYYLVFMSGVLITSRRKI